MAKKRSQRHASRAAQALDANTFRHIVVLMLENRSFDHMVGVLQQSIPDIDGVPAGPVRWNQTLAGRRVEQLPLAMDVVDPDPKHELSNVLAQLRNGNTGFVTDFEHEYANATADQIQAVMAYYKANGLPVLHSLARQFALCDQWYSPVPGPTWTNRLFAMSGTSLGRVKMPQGIFHPNLHNYNQPSVFRRLKEAGKNYRIYYGDFPLALLLSDCRTLSAAQRISTFDVFVDDARGAEADFPDFAFIEPSYLLNANDDHPPHPVHAGEALVAQVYNALRGNAELWESTLLVVTFDEHGGFYDHVSPISATPPDAHKEEYTFDRYGVRVPTIFIGSRVAQKIIHTACDHTALLRSLQKVWGLGDLGRRVAAAPDILSELSLSPAPRADVPDRLAVPKPKAAARAKSDAIEETSLNDNQRAIVAFSAYLETQTPQPPEQKVRSAARVLASPKSAMAVAEERAKRYLARKSRATRARKARNAASGRKPGRTR
jgi:phospholipase C